MKKTLVLLAPLSLVLAGALHAGDAPEAPVPVTRIVHESDRSAPAAQETQRLYVPAATTLIPVEQAQALVSRFKTAYEKLGSPRVVFYVNRQLVDTHSGVQLTKHTEHYAQSTTTTKGEAEKTVSKTSGQNTYEVKQGEQPALSDRQTVRDIERLFGRVFRAGGATLADQKIASDLIDNHPVGGLTGTSDQASKDREALAKVADVAVEILISSRKVVQAGISEDRELVVPDIQATAIRLKDAAIIGQAAATDILGKDGQAAQLAARFDVRDITEATALALIDDLASNAK